MANTPQARKRARSNERRRQVNQNRTSRIRNAIRNIEQAIAAGDPKAARQALQKAQPEIQRGVSNGVLHKNTAARKLSRLSDRIRKMAS